MLVSAASLRDGTPLSPPRAMEDLRSHALREYPRECVGLVDAAGDYVELVNRADRPEVSAVVDPSVIANRLQSRNIRAFCHSHPGGPDAPSESDMISQIEMEVPFIIVATNGQACAEPFAWGDELLDDAPLIGRSFRHGVHDCYGLIRSWFQQEQDITLMDFPRNWEWWFEPTPGDKNLYTRYFQKAGFVQIDAREVQVGDGWMAAIRSSVPNHAGVYVGDGLGLHHVSSGLAYDPTRLSKREPVARWTPYITHWVRYEC